MIKEKAVKIWEATHPIRSSNSCAKIYYCLLVFFKRAHPEHILMINVALHFLWNEQEYFSFDFPFGPDIRVKNFIEYQHDEQFTREVTQYVQEAAAQVLFYRNLCDIEIAKRYAKKWARKYKGNHRTSELDMINRLDDAEVLQKIKRTRAFWHSKPSMKRMKQHKTYDA